MVEKLESPYKGADDPYQITTTLIDNFPFKNYIVNSVRVSFDKFWTESKLGGIPIVEFDIPPTLVSNAMEGLIIKHLEKESEGYWRAHNVGYEKDYVCDKNPYYSMECKVSSHSTRIPGSKHSCFEVESTTKYRQGFYLVVNYHDDMLTTRLGWLDDTDWSVSSSMASGGAWIKRDIQKQKFKILDNYRIPYKIKINNVS